MPSYYLVDAAGKRVLPVTSTVWDLADPAPGAYGRAFHPRYLGSWITEDEAAASMKWATLHFCSERRGSLVVVAVEAEEEVPWRGADGSALPEWSVAEIPT